MTWNQFFTDLATACIPILAAALTALITAGVSYLTALAKQRLQERDEITAERYLSMLGRAATNAVVAMQQSTVDRLKKNGEWNETMAQEVKQKAVEIAQASLGDLTAEIQKQLKIDVPAYLDLLIEAALKNLKDREKEWDGSLSA